MKPVLIDVMLSGRFYTQLRYTKHGRPMIHNGDIIEVHKEEDIRKFVEESLPSIIGKDYKLAFANQELLKMY